jgi:predicted glycosyltransferase
MKLVIYKSNGIWYVTPKENYEARIQNARAVIKMADFNTAEEIINYYCKNIKISRDDFIVIGGN